MGRDGPSRAREPGSVRIGLDGFVGIAEVVDVENVEKLCEGNVLCVCWTFFVNILSDFSNNISADKNQTDNKKLWSWKFVWDIIILKDCAEVPPSLNGLAYAWSVMFVLRL